MDVIVKEDGRVLGRASKAKKMLGRDEGGIYKEFAERTNAPPLSL